MHPDQQLEGADWTSKVTKLMPFLPWHDQLNL